MAFSLPHSVCLNLLMYILLGAIKLGNSQQPPAPNPPVNPGPQAPPPGPSNPVQPVPPPSTNAPLNGPSGDQMPLSVNQTTNVPTPVTTTETRTTTMDIISVMAERDNWKDESGRLRTAVIVLGVFFAITAVIVIIGVVLLFLLRRNSKIITQFTNGRHQNKRTNRNDPQKTATAERNTGLQPTPKTENRNSDVKNVKQQQPDNARQKGIEEGNSRRSSTSSTSETYENQSRPVSTLSRPPPPVPNMKTDMNCPDTDKREEYVEVDEDRPRESKKEDKLKVPEARYQNLQEASETHDNYSALDTETQYEHHYDL